MNYVIAKVWDTSKPADIPNLGIYTYFETIHNGSIEDARYLRDEIQGRNPEFKYDIYPITIGPKVE